MISPKTAIKAAFLSAVFAQPAHAAIYKKLSTPQIAVVEPVSQDNPRLSGPAVLIAAGLTLAFAGKRKRAGTSSVATKDTAELPTLNIAKIKTGTVRTANHPATAKPSEKTKPEKEKPELVA